MSESCILFKERVIHRNYMDYYLLKKTLEMCIKILVLLY